MRTKFILDRLFGCVIKEQVSYFIEGRAIWRETVTFCERCEEVISRSQRRLLEREFWEDDELYLMPFADR